MTVMLAALWPFAAPAEVISPNGQIAYVACGPSNIPFGPPTQCDIWVMNSDGSGQTNLTNTPDQYEDGPTWSPDGLRIAYSSVFTGEVWAMDADGTNRTLVTPDGSSPTWSPAGTQIAFVRQNPGSPVALQWDIMVVDLVTGSEIVVSPQVSFDDTLADADEFEPAWSPDGERIAFAGVRPEQYPDPITGDPQQGAQWEIITVSPDGSDDQVVSAGDSGTDRASYLEEDRAPAWSPDGSMLAFMSQAQVPACCGPWQIWVMNRDGSNATNLTDDPFLNDLWPSWSPDGTRIIFQRADGAGGFNLYSMPAPIGGVRATPAVAQTEDGVVATPLTADGNATDPDWGHNPDRPPAGPTQYTLYVVPLTLEGRRNGGTVQSSPTGIRCGRKCSFAFDVGRHVSLTATPRRGWNFVGWSGGCTGVMPTCTVTMDDVRIVQASFARSP